MELCCFLAPFGCANKHILDFSRPGQVYSDTAVTAVDNCNSSQIWGLLDRKFVIPPARIIGSLLSSDYHETIGKGMKYCLSPEQHKVLQRPHYRL